MHVAVNAHLLNLDGGYRQAGISRYLSELLCAMWKLDPSIRWSVFTAPTTTAEALRPPASVRILPSKLRTSKPVSRIFWEQLIAPAVLSYQRPDVLFCPLNVVPLLAPCPTVVTVHDLAFIRFQLHRKIKGRYLATMTRKSVARATHIIALSKFTRSELVELLGVSPARITVVPNGCDTRFSPTPESELGKFRSRKDLPQDFLLFVGTLEPRKNLTMLLRAYSDAKDRLKVPLVVVGGRGWKYSPIFEEVRSLGLENDVRFEGFVSDEELPLYYGAASAFIYPSIYEGFGLPPLEAMACGTPVITSTKSSLPEVVGKAAICVVPDDRSALAEAMINVVADRQRRERLRDAGFVQAQKFNWELSAAATLNVLRKAATSEQRIRADEAVAFSKVVENQSMEEDLALDADTPVEMT